MDIFIELEGIGVDIEGTVKRFAGNKDIYKMFLLRLPDNEYYPKLKEFADNKTEDFSEFEKTAHSFKGNVGNMGMVKLWEPLQTIERQSRNQTFENIPEAFETFETEYRKIIDVIKKHM
jgi:HPt (histidine-containing phosphotransfer) domain-containing protein